MATEPGAPLSDDQTFFCLQLYLARIFCQNRQSASGPMQCKSGPVNNMVSKRNHLLYHFSITIHLPPCRFLRDNMLLKKN